MASRRGQNRDAERLSANDCDRQALAALKEAGHYGPSAADVSYRSRPDRRFDARGTGFAIRTPQAG